MSDVKFMVLKLQTEMEVLGQIVPISGCAGVCPVFDNEKDAKESADGRFQIIAVQIPPEVTP